MLEYFVYLIYRAGFALLSALPPRAAFGLGNMLGFCAWLALGKYRRLGYHNVQIAFGHEKSPQDMRRLAHKWGGSSSTCGMMAVLPSLAQLERMGQANQLIGATELHAETSRQLDRVRQFLNEYLHAA